MKSNRSIRVLFLDHAPVMGGAEHSLLDILAGFKDSSVEPVLLTPRQGKLYKRAGELGISIIDFPWRGRFLSLKRQDLERNPLSMVLGLPDIVGIVWRIRGILRREGFDAIYTNTLKSHILGGLAGRLAGVKVIWHFRDIPVQRVSRLVSRLGAVFLADRIIAVSRAVAVQFAPGKTTVIYNGFDFSRILRLAEEPLLDEMPGGLWLNGQGPVIGMVGQISRWKGPHVFLMAASLLAERHPEVRFLVIGGDIFGEEDYQRELREQVKSAGLDNKVAFTGHLDNTYPVMKRLSLLVHCPVEPEPFGRVVVESLALGVPVVASRTGAAEELIEDGVNGLLVPPGDPKALAKGVEKLWEYGLINKADKPILYASNAFSIQRTISSIEKEINAWVLGNK